MKVKDEIPFGIDFGTTKTCAAVWWNEKVTVVENDIRARCTPSFYYDSGEETLVGNAARYRDKSGKNPQNVYYDVKRILAQTIESPSIKKYKPNWIFELKGNKTENNLCEYVVNDTWVNMVLRNNETVPPLSAVSVCAGILRHLKELAEKQFQREISKTVIKIPAYLSMEQITAIYKAAKLADLNVVSFLTEPMAAAIAYGNEYTRMENEKLFIVDLGGGGFNIAIININNQKYKILAVSGNSKVGGRDFDNLICEWMKKKLREEGVDVEKLKQKIKIRMMTQAQTIKEALTSSQETPVILSDIFETAKSHTFKRSEFEEMSKDLLRKLESECIKILQKANLKAKDIDHILFVGGSSRMPMIATMLKKIFHDETKFSKNVNPDEVVAVGAAVFAAHFMKASKLSKIILLNIPDSVQFNGNISIAGISKLLENNVEI